MVARESGRVSRGGVVSSADALSEVPWSDAGAEAAGALGVSGAAATGASLARAGSPRSQAAAISGSAACAPWQARAPRACPGARARSPGLAGSAEGAGGSGRTDAAGGAQSAGPAGRETGSRRAAAGGAAVRPVGGAQALGCAWASAGALPRAARLERMRSIRALPAASRRTNRSVIPGRSPSRSTSPPRPRRGAATAVGEDEVEESCAPPVSAPRGEKESVTAHVGAVLVDELVLAAEGQPDPERRRREHGRGAKMPWIRSLPKSSRVRMTTTPGVKASRPALVGASGGGVGRPCPVLLGGGSGAHGRDQLLHGQAETGRICSAGLREVGFSPHLSRRPPAPPSAGPRRAEPAGHDVLRRSDQDQPLAVLLAPTPPRPSRACRAAGRRARGRPSRRPDRRAW